MMNHSELRRRIDAISSKWNHIIEYYNEDDHNPSYLSKLQSEYDSMVESLYNDLKPIRTPSHNWDSE